MTLFNSDPRVLGCTFYNNTNFALAMQANSLPTLRSNTASANGKNAIGVFGSNVSRSASGQMFHRPPCRKAPHSLKCCASRRWRPREE